MKVLISGASGGFGLDPGWVNIDIEPGADLIIDVRKGWPLDDCSVNFIYSEHFLEHLT